MGIIRFFTAVLSTGLLRGMHPEAQIDKAYDDRPERFEHRAFLVVAQTHLFEKVFVAGSIEGDDRAGCLRGRCVIAAFAFLVFHLVVFLFLVVF